MVQETSSEPDFAHACLHHPILSDLFHHKTYPAAEFIRTIGSPIKECGIVEEGCLKTTGYTIKGRELCTGYFKEGDVFPELLYFSGNKEYSYNLVAVKSSTVAWIDAKTFALVVQEDRQLCFLLISYLARRELKSRVLLSCTCYHAIHERVAFWILYMEKLSPDGHVIVPSQTIWANELRVSRASLNKEIRLMEDQGYFRIEGHLLEILDRESLEQLL